MKYIESFRNPSAAKQLSSSISRLAASLKQRQSAVRIMEVCGTHTMAVARYGINDVLPANVEVISGPGCPVCVTDPGYIDTAIKLAERGIIITTFGDMLNVPGSYSTLAGCRSKGKAVEICYSPEQALEIAVKSPEKEVVFLAIGFETTAPPVISIAKTAEKNAVQNISLLTAFKLVPPALDALISDPELQIDAFLCPAHVSAIIGSTPYRYYAEKHGKPCVIAGFEPLDVLLGIEGILKQIINKESTVENQYSRVVKPDGNPKAQKLIHEYLEPYDATWRGLGTIPSSGLRLRDRFSNYNAELRHDIKIEEGRINPDCLCGDVIKGKIKPIECPMFATACSPDHALGPCMVSQEGSCSAAFKYRSIPNIQNKTTV